MPRQQHAARLRLEWQLRERELQLPTLGRALRERLRSRRVHRQRSLQRHLLPRPTGTRVQRDRRPRRVRDLRHMLDGLLQLHEHADHVHDRLRERRVHGRAPLHAGLVCDSPPTSTCSDTSTLTTYGAGACGNGACSYAPINTSCASGCANGACTNNPCAGITCDEPPAATCLDATTRRSYSSAGMCTNGTCSYAPTDTTCMNGCEGGLCSGNACAGVSCDQPPAPTCTTPSSLRTFATVGTCAIVSCNYAPTDTACVAPTNGTASCTSGACGFTCNTGSTASGNECVMSIVSGGLTWTQVASGTTDDLLAVWGSGPNDVYAVGTDIILHSTNGGASWTPIVGTGGEHRRLGLERERCLRHERGAAPQHQRWRLLEHRRRRRHQQLQLPFGARDRTTSTCSTKKTLYHSIDGGTTWTTPNSSSRTRPRSTSAFPSLPSCRVNPYGDRGRTTSTSAPRTCSHSSRCCFTASIEA